MKEGEAVLIAEVMIDTLRNIENAEIKVANRAKIEELCLAFPVPESFVE
jgi:glycine/serine hydroxymethyltransferase